MKPSEMLELKPCNPLCTEVRDTCKKRLANSPHNPSRKTWNLMFNCDRFETESGMCVGSKAKSSRSAESAARKSTALQPPNSAPVVDQGRRQPSSSVVLSQSQSQSPGQVQQCSVCEYRPSGSEIRSLVCAPMTQFIVKIKEAKVQLVKKTTRSRTDNRKRTVNLYWRIQGKTKVLKGEKPKKRKGDKGKRKTYFYLQRPKNCKCDLFKNQKNFIVLGKYLPDQYGRGGLKS